LIFTDIYNKDHNERRKWESNNIDSLKNEETKELYKSNRLNINTIGHVILFLFNNLEVDNSVLKEQIEILKTNIQNFTPALVEGYFKNEPAYTYSYMEDKEKIEIVQKFSEIVKELIVILENKA
jgi:hypothetical protein